jgi:hypothetical protein
MFKGESWLCYQLILSLRVLNLRYLETVSHLRKSETYHDMLMDSVLLCLVRGQEKERLETMPEMNLFTVSIPVLRTRKNE